MAHEVQFVRGTFYKSGGGKTHLQHALRDRFDKNRIPEPNIRLQVFRNGQLQDADKQELYQAYDYNLNHRQRKNANVYFEYMVSDYDPSKTQEIAQFLSQKFEGRPVFIVEHMDEGHFHTHFILFWKDPEHTKAPNLKKADLHELRWTVGKITNQKVKERGTGLQKHVGPNSDPERTENLVKMQVKEAVEMLKIQNQIRPMLQVYGGIQIFSLNTEKGLRFQVFNQAGRTTFSDVDQLPMKKLLQLDQKPGENLIFIPEVFLKDGKQYVKGLFLDDVPEEAFNHLPNGTVIVQTSENKYQAHIPLQGMLDVETADQIQRLLVDFYEADPGAKYLLHPRRLPGMKNKKYKDLPVAKVIQTIENNITLDQILSEIGTNRDTNQQLREQTWQFVEKKSPEVARQLAEILETEASSWDRFFEETQDRSSADMKFVLRLLRKGFSPEAVALALMEVSPDLEIRKPKHVTDYIQRTINKALMIIQPNQTQQTRINPDPHFEK